MHILFIITDYGSFNNFLGEMALYMVAHHHRVSVICDSSKTIDIADKANYVEAGIAFHYVPFPRNFNIAKQYGASRAIHRLVNQIQPDFVHIHFTTAMSTTLLAGRLAFYTLGTVHGLGYPTLSHPLKRQIFKRTEHTIIKRLDEFWVLNQEDYNLLHAGYGKKIRQYKTAGIGCDTRTFKPVDKPVEKQALRKAFGIAENMVVFTFIGRFVHFKGFHLVVKAFLELIHTGAREAVLLLIGGHDALHPSGLSSGEERLIFRHPAIKQIAFTPDVASYLAITDLMVFPSVKEGMPVSIMEALAMHVPVLTSDTRGCNELVQDGINGYLTSARPNVEEVREAMLRFYKLHQQHSVSFDFGRSARSIARSDYINEQYQVYLEIEANLARKPIN